MDHFEQRFRALLSQMLDAELSAAEADELAHLCEADPSRSEMIRIELESCQRIRDWHPLQGQIEAEFFILKRATGTKDRKP